MKRQAVMFLVTLVACLAAAATAQAAPPIIERVPIDDQFRDEDSCAFPVQVHVTGFLVHIEWVAQNGDVRFVEASPQLKLTLTNLDTGGNHHGQRLWAAARHPERGRRLHRGGNGALGPFGESKDR